MDLDNGYMFTYRVTALYPTHFALQTLQLTFPVKYDTSFGTDEEVVDRIGKKLDIIERQNALEQMKIQVDRESNGENAKERLMGKARENNVPGEMFSMEEEGGLQCKLKTADWLDLICFEGQVSETIKR